jgi:isoamyl acetate esterase
MLMDKLPGRPLTSGLALSLPKEHLEKVARQFADIYVQLSTINFDKIGRLYRKGKEVDVISFVIGDNDELASPLATSLEYFYLNVRSRNRATLQSVPSADRVEDFKTAGWVLGQSLTNVVIERAMYGPYPLCHMDLHHGNILFNEQYDITGIVDWTGAQTVPWERLAANIEFVTFPGLSREDNMPIVAFREKVAACLKEQWGSGLSVLNPLPELIGSRTAEIVCRCTCSFSKPWRALTDAMLVARLLYGPTVTWEDLKAFRNISSTNTVDISETDGLSAQFKKMFSKPQST